MTKQKLEEELKEGIKYHLETYFNDQTLDEPLKDNIRMATDTLIFMFNEILEKSYISKAEIKNIIGRVLDRYL